MKTKQYKLHKDTALMDMLHVALSLKRPHNTETTNKFTQFLASTLPKGTDYYYDSVNNLHIDLRHSEANTTLFIAHVDTVHREQGINTIRKTDTHWYADGDVLGADDGAGVAMLMHLIAHGVPAYYIFSQGEEKGGIGATYIAKEQEWLLQQFDRAIAFDRRGIDSVITHQGWGRCCSDKFGNALADALGQYNDNLMHLIDDTGIYTDTAEFVDVIPECTNISIGYYSEHTQSESLDLVYFQHLADAVLRVDWDALPTDRDPTVKETKDWGNSTSMYGSYRKGTWQDKGSTINSPLFDDIHAANGFYYDYDYATEELHDALVEAQYGNSAWLRDLIAECVYPDDPVMAKQHIAQRYFSPELIEEAIRQTMYMDADSILFDLFDAAYAL